MIAKLFILSVQLQAVPISIYPLLNEPYLPSNHVQILVPKVVLYRRVCLSDDIVFLGMSCTHYFLHGQENSSIIKTRIVHTGRYPIAPLVPPSKTEVINTTPIKVTDPSRALRLGFSLFVLHN